MSIVAQPPSSCRCFTGVSACTCQLGPRVPEIVEPEARETGCGARIAPCLGADLLDRRASAEAEDVDLVMLRVLDPLRKHNDRIRIERHYAGVIRLRVRCRDERTPPNKVLEAVKDFAREEFALKHRYAMVLHTDEPHPHVHMVVKAVSERGVRLNIRKATLREWRKEFARHLRARGVEANATERAVRGNRLPAKFDGIYRAEQRGESHHTRTRAEAVARELLKGDLRIEQGKARLLETRKEVERGWFAVSDILIREGRKDLANDARRFVTEMLPPKTERELIAQDLRGRLRGTNARRSSPNATVPMKCVNPSQVQIEGPVWDLF